MSQVPTYFEPNGDFFDRRYVYECAVCSKHVWDCDPSVEIDDLVYCPDCAYKKSLITKDEYISLACFWCGNRETIDVGIHPDTGEIHIVSIKKKGREKFPWEQSLTDYRRSADYKSWRKAVFVRDSHTCLDCAIRGGALEAHHIKPFKKYPKLRFEIKNGATLCKKCHKIRHKTGEL